ncbi:MULTISPECIES: hypothetical protein [Paraburkholderia]|uniref:Uncharacterized protein n=1 Tax=Paraburkholderia madseniana TaxID=2599607 RepID=A0AAP5BAX0_9BURK|nr:MULTISPECIES: hypothetical protein [Paraburkholderia]MCX4145237.1 hypothetical protein [Paraburkholderia madseniana]MDN7148187.1 hypothetical protein [Paraburkholderia sp. WS6]MDQ6407067.1 hypothetical protein [Paraburkholderia madseniana]
MIQKIIDCDKILSIFDVKGKHSHQNYGYLTLEANSLKAERKSSAAANFGAASEPASLERRLTQRAIRPDDSLWLTTVNERTPSSNDEIAPVEQHVRQCVMQPPRPDKIDPRKAVPVQMAACW